MAVAGEEEVLRFEIAVDDALLVRRREAVGRSARASSSALRTGSGPSREVLAQRLALEQLGDEVRARPRDADVEYREDVGMLSAEAARASCSKRRNRSASARSPRQHLDRHLAAERVSRAR